MGYLDEPLAFFAGLVVLAGLAAASAAALMRPRAKRGRTFFVALWVALSAIRVGCFWYLMYRSWGGRPDRGLVLVAFLLAPEVLLGPSSYEWTVAAALLFSGALVVGSLLWAGVIAAPVFLIRMLFRRAAPRAPER